MPSLFAIWNSDSTLIDHLQLLVDIIQQKHPTEECAVVQMLPFEIVQPFSKKSMILSKPFQNLSHLFVV